MTDTTTTQLDAVRALTGIIRRAEEAGLPRLDWCVESRAAALAAQPLDLDDDDRTATIRKWATHFGVEIETEAHTHYTSVEISTEVDGIRVTVFTHVNEGGGA